MKKFAFALATAACLGLVAPAFAAGNATTAPTFKVAQTEVKVKTAPTKRVTKKVIVTRHDRGRHHGWTNRNHACKTVTVKSRHHGRVIVKKIRRCR